MLKKKKCATKKGKWSAEYKVKVSVSPLKKKKKGAWGRVGRCQAMVKTAYGFKRECGESTVNGSHYCSRHRRRL